MTATKTGNNDPGAVEPQESDPTTPLPKRPWWNRTIKSEDRKRCMTDLALVHVEHWAYRFTIMLTLSVIVAVMGLSLNSAAVVIGAMLLAPLMQPVLATGAALSMGLPGKSLKAATRVVAATAWCIAIAFIVYKLIPNTGFTDEIRARTQPDVRDLIVALAAGAAGAYATVRADASSSLPGVAVAVALVPPLATVGITLEAGDGARAYGAMLLYTTNLVAIIFSSILVFIITGFVPARRITTQVPRMVFTAVVTTAVVVLVAFPLFEASQTSIRSTEELADAEALVDVWLGGIDLEHSVEISEGAVDVVLRGFNPPPDKGPLEASFAARFPDKEVLVEWIRLEQATTTTTAPPPADEQSRIAVEQQVDEWLATAEIDYLVDSITFIDGDIRIDASGNGAPPLLSELRQRLDAIGETRTPRLNWTERETIELDDEVVTPLELDTESMRNAVAEWAGQRWVVRQLDYDGDLLVLELAGAFEPNTFQIRQLEQSLGQVDDDFTLELYFVQRVVVTTTTAAPPTTLT